MMQTPSAGVAQAEPSTCSGGFVGDFPFGSWQIPQMKFALMTPVCSLTDRLDGENYLPSPSFVSTWEPSFIISHIGDVPLSLSTVLLDASFLPPQRCRIAMVGGRRCPFPSSAHLLCRYHDFPFCISLSSPSLLSSNFSCRWTC